MLEESLTGEEISRIIQNMNDNEARGYLRNLPKDKRILYRNYTDCLNSENDRIVIIKPIF
jgi:hypothetical protein